MAQVNVKAVITAEDRASRTLQGFSAKSVAVGAAIGTALGVVAVRAVQGLASQLSEAAKRVDTLHNASRTFQNMGFRADEVRKSMDLLNKSILGLPTPLNEAVQGVTMLAAANNDVGKAQGIYSALNDAILGFGGTTADVSNAVLQLSQDVAGGRIQAQTWNSMLQSGLGPTLAAMARQMGITTGALKQGLSDGSISVQQFTDQLISMDKNGGGGLKSLHKIAMDSTNGIGTSFANAKTAIVRSLASIIDAVGQQNIANAIKVIGNAISDMIKAAASAIKVAINVGKFLEAHKIVLAAIAGAFAAIGIAITVAMLPAMIAAIGAGAAFVIAWLPIIALGAAIGAIAYLIINNWGPIKDFFAGLWSAITSAFTSAWDAIKTSFTDTFNFISGIFQAIYNVAIKPVIDTIVGVFHVLSSVWIYELEVIRGVALAVWSWIYPNVIKPVFDAISAGFNWIAGIASSIWGFIKNVAGAAWGGISAAAGAAWGFIANVANGAWGAIRSVWAGVAGWFGGVWNSITAGARGAGGGIASALSGAFNAAAGGIKATVNFLIDRINNVIGGVNATAGKLPGVPKLGAIGHLASGTDYWRGGLTMVGERGPELVNLPRGSSVTPNNQLAQVSQPTTVNVQFSGVFTGNEAEFRKLADKVFKSAGDVANSKNMSLTEYYG